MTPPVEPTDEEWCACLDFIDALPQRQTHGPDGEPDYEMCRCGHGYRWHVNQDGPCRFPDYHRYQETTEILSEPGTLAAIREGLSELDRGEGIPLEEVRRDLGL